jgi:hypothetical protein
MRLKLRVAWKRTEENADHCGRCGRYDCDRREEPALGLGAHSCYAPQSSEEVQMKVALLSLALFGTELMTPVSDRVPELNVDALCKARSADDKIMQLSVSQSVEDCMRDEKAAKQQLSTVWGSTFRPIRDRCESEVLFSLGTRSYLDLISCIQIGDDTRSVSPATKGTSKNRNTK